MYKISSIKLYPASLIYFAAVTLLLSSCRQKGTPDILTFELENHISYLASDQLEGRQTGTPGDSLAMEYIWKDLRENGLEPLSGDGYQRFQVLGKSEPGNNNHLSVNGRSLSLGKDFMPMAFSGNNSLESEVIYAGYGLSISNDSIKWNDYDNINVGGKWILVLRGDPDTDKVVSGFLPFSSDRDKAMLAKDMGAAGVLMVSGPAFDPDDVLEPLSSGDHSVGLPVFRIKREIADMILQNSGNSVEVLEKKLNSRNKTQGFSTGISVRGSSEIITGTHSTRNVVMMLPGEDPELSKEYLIIGAHADHLGMGGASSRKPDTTAIHPGADDNASGVGAMLELAEKFALTKGSNKRSLIFIAFSGEEMGLLGSKYFVENAGIDLSAVNAMINLDMLGRFQETNSLQVGGVGTAEGLKDLILSLTDTSFFRLSLSDEGYGPSDHSSFYGKNIPVLFFTTGAHLDYHTPHDTHDRINYEGMIKVSDQIYEIASALASDDQKLKFRESGPRESTSKVMRRRGVTLGIMPDFAGNVKNGLRADFVTPGRPADRGGMKKGDIIISINGKPVNNIQDYMFRMNQLKHGQTINVEIIRNNKKELLLIQL